MADFADIRNALDHGRHDEAGRLLQDRLPAEPDSPELQELLCECLRRRGEPEAALAASARATELAPARASAWQEMGRTLNNLGRLPAARTALLKARDLAPDDAVIQHDLAHVSRRLGDSAAAREGLEAAIRLRPDWASAWYRLGSLELAEDNLQAAEKCLRRSLEIDSSNPAALTALGAALHRLGKLADAVGCYRRALQVDPGYPDAWGNLGITLQEDGRTAEAIEAYSRALELRPDDYQAGTHLGDAFLQTGRPQEALLASARLLRRFPGHSGALATRSIALMRTGNEDAYRNLVDIEQFVLAVDIEVPQGFANLDEFNDALVRHVQSHESLRYQPVGHATRFGHHTGDLMRFEKGPTAALENAVGDAAKAYQQLLNASAGHPLAASRPPTWKMSLWSVIMQSQGHQLPHIHPSAWLSGVYYARVPEIVSAASRDEAGWIEFGQPPAELAGNTNFPVRRFMPREGLMLLFPAYFYHQTIPFNSEELRVSLAFDLAPARPDGDTIR